MWVYNWRKIWLNSQYITSRSFSFMMANGHFLANLGNHPIMAVVLWIEQLNLISKFITHCVPIGTLCLCCIPCKMGLILVSTSWVAIQIKRDNINIQHSPAHSRPSNTATGNCSFFYSTFLNCLDFLKEFAS